MSLPEVPTHLLDKTVAHSLGEVFGTMLSFSCAFQGGEELSGAQPAMPELGGVPAESVFVGSVGFVGGINGMVYLYLKASFARMASRKMTGLEDGELDAEEIVADVCGELTNMFAGSLKNSLADLGYSATLTIPSVLNGEELFVMTLGAKRHLRQRFLCEGQAVATDVLLAEPVAAA